MINNDTINGFLNANRTEFKKDATTSYYKNKAQWCGCWSKDSRCNKHL